MLRRVWSTDDGVVAPIAVLIMIALIGFCAFVLDVGTIYANRRALQNAADAAALAGAKELQVQLLGGTSAPASQALSYAAQNGVAAPGAGCTPDGNATVTYNNPSATRPNSWEVTTSRLVRLSFGPVIGISTMCVNADAVAVVTSGSEAKLFPFAIYSDTTIPPTAKPGTSQSCDPNAMSGNPYCFVLKEGSSGSASGNFGILDFLCTGSSGKVNNYIYWAENGYGSRAGESIPVNIPPGPWTVCTFTGNTATANNDIDNWVATNLANPPQYCPKARIDPGYVADFRCPLIGLLPVLKDTSLGNGSSSTVQIVNFAVFEIVGLAQDQNGVGHQQIVGQFLQWAAAVGPTRLPDPSGQLAGPLMIRLVQ